ncbi:MAG TPA: DUF3667 domain-containing protein [Steroidobacteraceae bacterium]|nr:DUF3667 domain-containing protein [Steroidobacteraceae bacterium]
MNTAAPPVSHPPAAAPGAGPDATPIATAPRNAGAWAPPVAAPVVAARCDNCGAPVTEKYCGNCGQRLEPPVHSLWHFMHVALEDMTHADSRLWRTLAALLFKPGFLTREFLAARRARYLPPVRLYLVLSVAFFLYASMTHDPVRVLQIHEHDRGPPTASVTQLDNPNDSSLAARPGESAQQRAERVCNNSAYAGPFREFVVTRMHQVCVRSVVDKGRSMSEAMLHSLPRAMFVFLPLLAAAMMLMYWRPRHYYVEHLLLFVHNHAFVFLLLLLAGVVSTLLPSLSSWLDLGVTLYIAWYVFRSMRVVYGQGRWLTLGKFALLSFFYVVSGSIMFALTFLYSAVTM